MQYFAYFLDFITEERGASQAPLFVGRSRRSRRRTVDAEQRSRHQTVGEDTHYYAGANALAALEVFAKRYAAPPTSFAGGALMNILAMTLETCALMTRSPREQLPHEADTLTDEEIYFATRCKMIMGTFAPERVVKYPSFPALACISVPLFQKWQELQRSPALELALSHDMQQSFARTRVRGGNRLHAMAASQCKRSCELCGVAEEVRGDYKACGRCRNAFYCSREHQEAHWSAHKPDCKRQ